MRRALAALLAVTLLAVSGCGNGEALSTPVNWWHDLQGGEIAATRPPPPGTDLPYPHIGTVPPKPVLPTHSLRDTVRTQLTQERDDTQRLAARNPIEIPKYVPPPPPPAAPTAATPATGTGPGAQSGAADSQAADTANATLPGADAPPPRPAQANSATQPADDGGPAPGTPLTVAGSPADAPGLVVPDAPPAPASFEGVPAQPAPTPPPPLPAHTPAAANSGQVLFATGSAVLDPSQTETLSAAMAHRAGGHIDIEGHGDTQSDSPSGQEAALQLGVNRAASVAAKLEKMGVPPDDLILSATAFGRGASVRPDGAPPPTSPAAPLPAEKPHHHQNNTVAGAL